MFHGGGTQEGVVAVLLVQLLMPFFLMEKATWYVSMVARALSLECPTFVLISVLMKTGHLENAILLIISLALLKTLLQLALQEVVGFLH